jgi:hypothetical protein
VIDSQFFGLKAGGHLFMNALIHVSNTLLLFLFLGQATGLAAFFGCGRQLKTGAKANRRASKMKRLTLTWLFLAAPLTSQADYREFRAVPVC